jgi:hypothetical protein
MSTETLTTPAAGARDYERISINIPRGSLLTRLKREADATGASLSATAVRALARGLRGGDADDRLLKLERKLADHMRAASRDAMVQQELIVMIARTLLLHHGLDDAISETRSHRVEAVIDRMLATVLANITSGRTLAPEAADAPQETV